jgi:hypothetical protein
MPGKLTAVQPATRSPGAKLSASAVARCGANKAAIKIAATSFSRMKILSYTRNHIRCVVVVSVVKMRRPTTKANTTATPERSCLTGLSYHSLARQHDG